MNPVSGARGVSTPPAPVIKPPAAKPEVQESAQVERTEAQRGTQEAGETQAAPPANPSVGTRLNVTA
ncbi:hypothetical protein GETHLI_12760 [Geothrix limicola]|uniref:Uncharacterized protein n=1 Tax=Geothrix limicola TaxID=2927978 RepID=A0ABQ5QD58_9BACT|nr:hypothetical protein [Geothrix limicola]GLH72774.1 hypothetical protein GETHLI_12760 [Geothrix limicola]